MKEQTFASVLSITDTDLNLHFPEITNYVEKILAEVKLGKKRKERAK